MNESLQIIIQKLAGQIEPKGDQKHDSERTGGEKGAKAPVEVKDKEIAATVSGDDVVKMLIWLWATVVVYIVYAQEWLPRRERRWMLRDKALEAGSSERLVVS